jgi:hypothetical protein
MLSGRNDPRFAVSRNDGCRVLPAEVRIGSETTMMLGNWLITYPKARVDDASHGGEDHMDAEFGELTSTGRYDCLHLGRGHPGQSFLTRQVIDSWHPDVLDFATFVVSCDNRFDALRADVINSAEHGLKLGPARPVS